jgi:ribosomal protein S18 acetylase RimI-like enzyme
MILRGERLYMSRIEPGSLEAWTGALDRNLALWIDNLDRTLVAVDEDGGAVGYVMWTPSEEHATIVTIHVSPDVRRQGVGRVLLDAAARDAREAGATAVDLGVHRDNPARALYERAGFTRTGDDGDYLLYSLAHES